MECAAKRTLQVYRVNTPPEPGAHMAEPGGLGFRDRMKPDEGCKRLDHVLKVAQSRLLSSFYNSCRSFRLLRWIPAGLRFSGTMLRQQVRDQGAQLGGLHRLLQAMNAVVTDLVQHFPAAIGGDDQRRHRAVDRAHRRHGGKAGGAAIESAMTISGGRPACASSPRARCRSAAVIVRHPQLWSSSRMPSRTAS